MTVYFVSRHAGAIEWMKQQTEWQIDQFVPHLDSAQIQAGDVVLGTLPLHLVAEVCERGASFYFLMLPQQFVERGIEHSAESMLAAGAKLQRFHVQRMLTE